MSAVAETGEGDAAVGPDGHPRDGGVEEGDAEPGLGRDLEGAADEVADHVGVTDHQLVGVLLLL